MSLRFFQNLSPENLRTIYLITGIFQNNIQECSVITFWKFRAFRKKIVPEIVLEFWISETFPQWKGKKCLYHFHT